MKPIFVVDREQEELRAAGCQGYELFDLINPAQGYVRRTSAAVREIDKGEWTDLTPDAVAVTNLHEGRFNHFRIEKFGDGEIRSELNHLRVSKELWEAATPGTRGYVRLVFQLRGQLEAAMMTVLDVGTETSEETKDAAAWLIRSFCKLMLKDRFNKNGFPKRFDKGEKASHGAGKERITQLRLLLKLEQKAARRADSFGDTWATKAVAKVNELLGQFGVEQVCSLSLVRELESSTPAELARKIYAQADRFHRADDYRRKAPRIRRVAG